MAYQLFHFACQVGDFVIFLYVIRTGMAAIGIYLERGK